MAHLCLSDDFEMYSIVVFCVSLHFFGSVAAKHNELVLFDFRRNFDLSSWTEQSDTSRKGGASVASFVPLVTDSKRSVVLFTLLDPVSNRTGGFAGYKTETRLDLGRFECLALRVRGRGANTGYKLVLRHKGENDAPYAHYVHFFTAPTNRFGTVVLPLKKFQAYLKGKPVIDAPPLDTRLITSIGIQIYNGIYAKTKQTGTSSLEIDWILALD